MIDKGKLDISSYNFWIFTTNEQKLCTAYRELVGIVFWLTICKHITIGSDHFINVLNDHEPIVSCFTKKGNISPILYTAQMQLNKFQRIPFIYPKAENHPVTDMLGRSFTPK